ncbi:MAG: SpoIIIAH-like family protein [Candidatus Limiplasma sp.]|nr:SpoIIIAH-like family protein [Candidatus Limiplasma sp.]
MNKKWGQQGEAAPKKPVSGKKEAKEKPAARGHWLRAGALVLLMGAAGALLWGGGFHGLMNKIGGGGSPSGGLEGLLKNGKLLLGAEPSPTPKAGQALAEQRSLRERAYEEDRAALGALSQNPEVAEKTREDAAAQLALMVASHQSELGIEEALKAAGFDPCLVLLQNGALTVMVRLESLTSAQSATILSLCAAHTQVGVENIRIMTGS